MTDRNRFHQEQLGVALAMVAALCTTIVVIGATLLTTRTPPLPFMDRLQSTIRLDLWVLMCLAAAIANVARLRFFSDRDIAGSSHGSTSESVRQAGAILQNTLEQVVLAVGAHFVVAASFARSQAIIAALVSLFVAGRFLFWIGYGHGARGRAFGFALTFYPSALALAGSAVACAIGRAG